MSGDTPSIRKVANRQHHVVLMPFDRRRRPLVRKTRRRRRRRRNNRGSGCRRQIKTETVKTARANNWVIHAYHCCQRQMMSQKQKLREPWPQQ